MGPFLPNVVRQIGIGQVIHVQVSGCQGHAKCCLVKDTLHRKNQNFYLVNKILCSLQYF